MSKEVDIAWKELCAGNKMQKAFADVGLSLNKISFWKNHVINGSEDHKMQFQGQPAGKPDGVII